MENAKYDQEFVKNAIVAFQNDSKMKSDIDDYMEIFNGRKTGSSEWKDIFWYFYQIQRAGKSKDEFFAYMDDCEGKELDIKTVHEVIRNQFNGEYVAYTTALMNTVNEKYPLCNGPIIAAIEERFRGNINYQNLGKKDYLERYYKVLEAYYGMFLSGEADRYIEAFNARFPDLGNQLDEIPKSKKVDYVLWSYGAKLIADKEKQKSDRKPSNN